MLKNLLVIALLIASWAFVYSLGLSKAEVKYVTKEKEVIRYEKNCAVNLIAQPSLADDNIMRLLNAGKL